MGIGNYRGFRVELEKTEGGEYYGVIKPVSCGNGPWDLVDCVGTADGIENQFHDAVDDYVAFCRDIGKPLPAGCD